MNTDTNEHWREVFSLQPNVLVEIWTPFVFSTISIAQHFDGFRWPFISDTWFRAFAWLLFWSLFGMFGYGSNWGVVCGFINCLWTTPFYLMCIFLRSEYMTDLPVLDFGSEAIKEHAKKLSLSQGVTETEPDKPMADYLASRGAIMGMLCIICLHLNLRNIYISLDMQCQRRRKRRHRIQWRIHSNMDAPFRRNRS